jgi:L-galactono-1,4-lactone dehydrogenase
VEAFLRVAAARGERLRPVGSGLSPNGSGLSSEGVLSLADMDRMVVLDKPRLQVGRARAGRGQWG